jgi:hypothetical protein
MKSRSIKNKFHKIFKKAMAEKNSLLTKIITQKQALGFIIKAAKNQSHFIFYIIGVTYASL